MNGMSSLSSLFKGKVHEPIMLLLKLRDPEDAMYLEHSIGAADLECFVCEEASDASELLRRLRHQEGLRTINVFHSVPPTEGEFQVKLEGRRPLTFGTFLSKCISCPPAVMVHLCNRRKLHEVPIFKGYAKKD